jgi:hypothetical protein
VIDAASREIIRRRREHRAALMRARWADPEYRARQAAVRSANMKALWSDSEAVANLRAKLVARNRSKAQREAARAAVTKLNADAAFRAENQRRLKELHNRPDIKATFIAMVRLRNKTRVAKQRASRQIVPPGQMKLYRKLRAAGIERREALRECWREAA